MTSFASVFRRRPTQLAALASLTLAASLLAACEPTFDTDQPAASKGEADFSRYIAVGNSLTAGFGDNGLYREGQLNSYPSLLATQFATVGGGAFDQPLFAETQANGTGYLSLRGFTATGSPMTAPMTGKLAVRDCVVVANPKFKRALYAEYPGAVSNLGVPGLRMSEIDAPSLGDPRTSNRTGPFNALFERITPDATPTQTYLQRVAAANPTFFTCWLGNNDVLGFATSGGALEGLSAASYGFTDLAVFTEKATKLIDALVANKAKGMVGNIPNVTAIPFFNTVGPPTKALLMSKNITQLVTTTGTFAFASPTRQTIDVADIKDAAGGRQLFTLTASPYVGLIGATSGQGSGKYWRDFAKQLQSSLGNNALVTTLSLWEIDTTKAFGLSSANPFPSTLLLDVTEQARVQQATTAFNNALKAKADAAGLAYFDAYTFFDNIAAQGIATNGVNNTTTYISGNLFSLDGVHPTPRGYAVIANEMLRLINAKYKATVPLVNPTQYRGVRYQQ